MLGGDDMIDLCGLRLAHNPPEWDLPFKLEYLPVLEWPVIFEPGVNRLKCLQGVSITQKKGLKPLTETLFSHPTLATLFLEMMSGP